MMTECLERSVLNKDIHIFDKMQVVKVLTDGARFCGLLCLNLAGADNKSKRFTVFACKNVIYATGGPAGMYADSAYPFGHYGATGLAFDAGVMGKNLTEWQYGLASVKPRWNVSGTYMQVLPKFISTDLNSMDEREFLFDFLTDYGKILDNVFLKGYQWPFDVRKIDNGSSVIDLLVYMETCIKGRRVFLDFRQNPHNQPVDFTMLSDEPREYLEKAGAAFGTPIERLMHMNSPAVDFYMDKGIDLSSEPLEIALCAQHNNGGLGIDKWWQTNMEGFFAAGEAAGSHGVYRPGGSALNAGQVGSTRAAQYIARNCQGEPMDSKQLLVAAADQIKSAIAIGERVVGEVENVQLMWDEATKRMSRFGAAIRSGKGIQQALSEIQEEILGFAENVRITNTSNLSKVFRLYDTLICQYVYLSAMVNYAENGGKSRGSALYSDDTGRLPYESLPPIFSFTLDNGSLGGMVQEVMFNKGECSFTWRKVREIPQDDDFFENVWRSYRQNGNIY
jgi:succinate dehydrogenase/fumarate reductase flavoprotein subunit